MLAAGLQPGEDQARFYFPAHCGSQPEPRPGWLGSRSSSCWRFPPWPLWPRLPQTIEQIRVIGNRRIPKETILARLFTHPGDTYDPISIERDFNSLWNTGYFEDLRIEREDTEKGIILNVFVRERPTIREINYKGNNSISNSDILDRFKKEKVGLSVEGQFDPTTIKRAESVIREMLAEHGHQFATIKTDVKTIPPASVQVNFNIKEGPTVKVGNIRFTGNQHISSLVSAPGDEEPEAHRHSLLHHL